MTAHQLADLRAWQKKIEARLVAIENYLARVHGWNRTFGDRGLAERVPWPVPTQKAPTPVSQDESLVSPPYIQCHPGLKCTAWPECESCGPPRL